MTFPFCHKENSKIFVGGNINSSSSISGQLREQFLSKTHNKKFEYKMSSESPIKARMVYRQWPQTTHHITFIKLQSM
jgi:hypothetical protein